MSAYPYHFPVDGSNEPCYIVTEKKLYFFLSERFFEPVNESLTVKN